MKIIVFDLETTGLPIQTEDKKYHNYEDIQFYDSSRIVSICWNIYDETGEMVSCNYHIIKNKDFDIDNDSYATQINGITKEKSKNYGKDINKILEDFSNDCKHANQLIAHNIQFDYNIILSECFRYGLTECILNIKAVEKFCTKINSYYLIGRYLKLVELYDYFNNKTFEGQHNALKDVEACANCYFNLVSYS